MKRLFKRWIIFVWVLVVLSAGGGSFGTVSAEVYAYVSNPNVHSMSVINTSTNTVVATIGICCPRGIAVRPDGAYIYVVSEWAHWVVVIDTASGSWAIVPVGFRPRMVVFTPDGAFAYVTNNGSPGTVSVIDTATHTVVQTVGVGPRPDGMAITPDGAFVYISHLETSRVSVMETAGNTVVDTVEVDYFPSNVTITPDGAYVYVGHSEANTVAVIDTSTNTVVDRVEGFINPSGMDITPDGAFVYVSNGYSDTVAIIDTSTNTIADTVVVGTHPTGLAITPDGAFVYVVHPYYNWLSVIEIGTNTVVDTVTVGWGPQNVAFTPLRIVAVDIKPGGCPNPLNVKSKGKLPAAVLGNATFDVSRIDTASVRLEGVAPLRFAFEDVATPFKPFTRKVDCSLDCRRDGPDGFPDLTLKFDTQAIAAALGEVEDGECRVLHLTGKLKAEFGGMPIEGEGVVIIKKKGK